MVKKPDLIANTREIEEEDIDAYEDKRHNGDHPMEQTETADVIAIKYVKDTPRNKMAEVSDIPLDLQRTITMIRLHVDDVIGLCEDIVKAQEVWQANWEYWNIPSDEQLKAAQELAIKDGVFIEKYTEVIKYTQWQRFKARLSHHELDVEVTKEREVSAKQILAMYNRKLAEKKLADDSVEEWQEFVQDLKDEKTHLLSDNFVYYYLQGRRSKEGKYLDKLIDVSRDQIAAKGQMSSDDIMKRAMGDNT